MTLLNTLNTGTLTSLYISPTFLFSDILIKLKSKKISLMNLSKSFSIFKNSTGGHKQSFHDASDKNNMYSLRTLTISVSSQGPQSLSLCSKALS